MDGRILLVFLSKPPINDHRGQNRYYPPPLRAGAIFFYSQPVCSQHTHDTHACTASAPPKLRCSAYCGSLLNLAHMRAHYEYEYEYSLQVSINSIIVFSTHNSEYHSIIPPVRTSEPSMLCSSFAQRSTFSFTMHTDRYLDI